MIVFYHFGLTCSQIFKLTEKQQRGRKNTLCFFLTDLKSILYVFKVSPRFKVYPLYDGSLFTVKFKYCSVGQVRKYTGCLKKKNIFSEIPQTDFHENHHDHKNRNRNELYFSNSIAYMKEQERGVGQISFKQ